MPGQPQASVEPKLIYFATRRAAMDSAAFVARWREHARLGMSMPRWSNVRRYVHCDAQYTPQSRLPSRCCDGVAMIWYRDEARRLAHVTDRSAAPVMRRDEAETFARPVRESALLADEFILEPMTATASKLFLRLWRREGVAREAFRRWRLETIGESLCRRLVSRGQVKGYVQNHARLEAGEHSPPDVCDCIDEIACDDIEACEAALLRAQAELAGCDAHISAIDAIWTAETLLHDLP